MADLTRTKCGRILRREKHMLSQIAITCFHIRSYKKLFSPLVRKTRDFAQNLMGYHSEVVAFSNISNFVSKMKYETKTERQFR